MLSDAYCYHAAASRSVLIGEHLQVEDHPAPSATVWSWMSQLLTTTHVLELHAQALWMMSMVPAL